MTAKESGHIIKLKRGSFAAFDHLFSKYKERLFAFSIGYLKLEEDAEEIVQEVFVKVWENRAKLDETRSFDSYLFTISKNTILNHLRKKVHERSYIDSVIKNAEQLYSSIEEDIEYEELLEQTEQIIQQLSPRQKEIYRLSREKGFSNEEIASKLDISKKTVENQITLAVSHIRKQLSSQKMLGFLFSSLFL